MKKNYNHVRFQKTITKAQQTTLTAAQFGVFVAIGMTLSQSLESHFALAMNSALEPSTETTVDNLHPEATLVVPSSFTETDDLPISMLTNNEESPAISIPVAQSDSFQNPEEINIPITADKNDEPISFDDMPAPEQADVAAGGGEIPSIETPLVVEQSSGSTGLLWILAGAASIAFVGQGVGPDPSDDSEAPPMQIPSITGQKWFDWNGDGIKDPGEIPLGNWRIYIDGNGNNQFDANEQFTFTDSNGFYTFYNLQPGTYSIGEEIKPGWVQTTPIVNNGMHNVDYNNELVENIDFGNKGTQIISGEKILMGVESEPFLLDGWHFFVDLNNDGQFTPGEPEAFSDIDGNFIIEMLPPNETFPEFPLYLVYEDPNVIPQFIIDNNGIVNDNLPLDPIPVTVALDMNDPETVVFTNNIMFLQTS